MKKTVDTPALNQLIKKTEKDLRLENQPNYKPEKDPNLLRRIKYFSEIYDGNKLGSDFDKLIDQEDGELAKLGRSPQNILQRNKLPAASNKQLASRNKKQGEAQKIAAFIKKEKRKQNPILNVKPVNIDISSILKPATNPEPVTTEDVQAEIDKFAKTQPKDPELNGIFATNEYFLRKKGI
tara:strand:+ start:1766 stop:2308 length:543 start_codon:yes stop_codon:yes gene_type:complete